MSGAWPWLAVAGLGALHGLNPGSGWMLAAAVGGERRQALRALGPIGAGHLASVALVAAVAALGRPGGRTLLLVPAVALLVGVAVRHGPRRDAGAARRASATRAALALWAFIGSTVHGAGLMLVPALVPLCMADTPARAITASGSLPLALAAVALHAVAMLAVSGALAVAACRLRRRRGSGLQT
jgi:hypothetical protein